MCGLAAVAVKLLCVESKFTYGSKIQNAAGGLVKEPTYLPHLLTYLPTE
jgi:hypothetical protein